MAPTTRRTPARQRRTGALTPAQFFAAGFDGGSMHAAHYATGISYSTVHRAKNGGPVKVDTAQRLDAWSRTVASAATAGAWIDAARTLGLDASSPFAAKVA